MGTAQRFSSNWGLPAPKGKGKKGYKWAVTGAIVAKMSCQETGRSKGLQSYLKDRTTLQNSPSLDARGYSYGNGARNSQ